MDNLRAATDLLLQSIVLHYRKEEDLSEERVEQAFEFVDELIALTPDELMRQIKEVEKEKNHKYFPSVVLFLMSSYLKMQARRLTKQLSENGLKGKELEDVVIKNLAGLISTYNIDTFLNQYKKGEGY